jgi:ribokinase
VSLSPLDVVVVGSLHLDIIVRSSHLPALDETARGSEWRMVCGGKGGNQACWAARLGAKTAMISRVGRDDFGDRLLENLRAGKVDVSGVTVDKHTGSGMSVAILDRNGDYGAVIVSGSNLTISIDDAVTSLGAFTSAKVLILQNEIEEPVNLAAARWAKSVGAQIILNAAPARYIGRELAGLIDVFVVNRVEASMMSSKPVTNRDDALRSIPALFAYGKNVIVTLGGDGVVLAQHGLEPLEITAHDTIVKSTHGAGDCFVAQLAAGISDGKILRDAAVLANATAAAYVSGRLSLTGN